MKLIEPPTRVRESQIWSLQEEFYNKQGPQAWSDCLVPEGPTSNCYIANVYATIIAAFFRDLKNAGLTQTPLILEVGGGNGTLAWKILHRLMNYELLGDEADYSFNYLLTDGSRSNLESWKTKARFKPLLESGVLEFGTLWVEEKLEIHTERSGVINHETLKDRPVILVANYLFDSIPTDLYRVKAHSIYREYITLHEKEPQKIQADESLFGRIDISLSSRECESPYTGHTLIDAVLESYRMQEGEYCIPVPEQSLQFMESFLNRNAPFLTLAGDLGYTEPDSFKKSHPFILDHYLAYYTNFHLMGELVKHYGGDVEFQAHEDRHFSTVAFVKGVENYSFDETRRLARLQLRDFTPYDAYSVIQTLRTRVKQTSYRRIESWLRLSRFDEKVARACIPLVLREHRAGRKLRKERLREIYLDVYAAYFPNGRNDKFDLEVASFLKVLGFTRDALNVLEQGIADFGETQERQAAIQALSKVLTS